MMLNKLMFALRYLFYFSVCYITYLSELTPLWWLLTSFTLFCFIIEVLTYDDY